MKDKKPNIENCDVTARVVSRILRKNGFKMCNMKDKHYWTDGIYVDTMGVTDKEQWVVINWHKLHQVYIESPAYLRLIDEQNKVRQFLTERGYVFDSDLDDGSLRIKCKGWRYQGGFMKDKKPNIKNCVVTARVISRLLRKNGFEMCNMKDRHFWTNGIYVEASFDGCVEIGWHDKTLNYNDIGSYQHLRINEKKNKVQKFLSERGYVFDIDLSATSSNPPLRIKCES